MGIKSLERELAAIFNADVAGYSRLTGEDEEGTHCALSVYLGAKTDSIERLNGKIMHVVGDAVRADVNVTLVYDCLQEGTPIVTVIVEDSEVESERSRPRDQALPEFD